MNLEKIKELQLADGSFGQFHSMSSTSPITTEKILRRFMFLGIKKDNPLLSKTLNYLKKCLDREIEIPDRREKVMHWDVFLDLMFSTWLTIFDDLNDKALGIRNKWSSLISSSIENSVFNTDIYKSNYEATFGKLKTGMRVIDPTNFYMVSLLKDCLDKDTSKAYFNYILETGIYYIHSSNLTQIPNVFDSKSTINYLYAIKLTANYNFESPFLEKVKSWILDNQNKDGYWYMNNLKPDGIIFPTSCNWRTKNAKLNDTKRFMENIITEISKEQIK